MTHKTSTCLSMFLLTLFLAGGCRGSAPSAPSGASLVSQKPVVGHWVGADKDRWVELTNKGTVAIVTNDHALIGNYTTQGEAIAPKFVATGTDKPSRSAGMWQMQLAKDKLQVTNPEKQVDEYQRSDPDPQLKDSPLLGRWEWTRKGTSNVNSLEFTPWGTFISVRWLHPKKAKGGAKNGDLEELREAGQFRVEGTNLFLTTFRHRQSSRKLKFEVVKGLGADKLVVTHARKDGSTATAGYKRAL